jgi:hypothetical protein
VGLVEGEGDEEIEGEGKYDSLVCAVDVEEVARETAKCDCLGWISLF